MFINQIKKLNNVGIFRDFTWPAGLPEFAQYNLIYGWNASGKTTLSRLFRRLEQPKKPMLGEVELKVDGETLSSEGFSGATVPIKVFNRDFVNDSVLLVDGLIKPIFVIGPKNVAAQQERTKQQDKLAEVGKRLENERTQLREAEKARDRLCQEGARRIRDLRGLDSNAYKLTHFQQHADKMWQAGDAVTKLLDNDLIHQCKQRIVARQKEPLVAVSYGWPDLAALSTMTRNLLSKTVVSSAIANLLADSALAEWVEDGVALHREKEAQKCLFCEQPLPPERMAALEAHFNDEFARQKAALQKLSIEVDELSSKASNLPIPDEYALQEELQEGYGEARNKLRGQLQVVNNYLALLAETLRGKQQRLFEAVSWTTIAPEVDTATLDSLNGLIERHNKLCRNFAEEVRKAHEKLEAHVVAEELDNYSSASDMIDRAKGIVESSEEEEAALKAAIVAFDKELRDDRTPANELNTDLQSYLGHGELCFEAEEVGYTITRNGDQAVTSLSEGEQTAIALLYFLKSLKDSDFDLERSVVVLDDPVSSLDSNALYTAFGFIKAYTHDAGQLFVLTHNFTFFRMVRNWFKYLPAHLYMLECCPSSGIRTATITRLDSLLADYESDYHYLFAVVYRTVHTSDASDLAGYYVLPNVARRLLEAFLAFKFPGKSSLHSKLKEADFAEDRKHRLERFVQVHSHLDTLEEPEHDPAMLRESPVILNDLLDLMKENDEKHFMAMEGLVPRSTAPLNSEE